MPQPASAQTFRIASTLLLSAVFQSPAIGQDCIGGAINTHEAYLHGRFEVAMRSASGEGVVSSFFLYNLDIGCNWPSENNEIDIEMTGNDQTVQFTTHYPGTTQPWYYTDNFYYGFNPHDSIHAYAIEWEPGIVRWFIDGELANVQAQPFVEELIYPMRIIMNLWAVDNPDWAGTWDPSQMPLQSEYEYVRCYSYTPGSGDHGTNNNFSLLWEDEFNYLDEERWEVEQFGGFGGNLCSFEGSGVEFLDGRMLLQILEAVEYTETTPVTISVDVNQQDFLPSDIVNLNGTFNNWCGQCMPMSESNGIWTRTVNLLPGKHEFIFTKNFWEENGGAPLNSECDFKPCDEYVNYGVEVIPGSDPIVLPTICWGECTNCATTGLDHLDSTDSRNLLFITDAMGRIVDLETGRLLILHFDNGDIEKTVIYN